MCSNDASRSIPPAVRFERACQSPLVLEIRGASAPQGAEWYAGSLVPYCTPPVQLSSTTFPTHSHTLHWESATADPQPHGSLALWLSCPGKKPRLPGAGRSRMQPHASPPMPECSVRREAGDSISGHTNTQTTRHTARLTPGGDCSLFCGRESNQITLPVDAFCEKARQAYAWPI